jgi:hypothetical protein
VFVGVPVGVLVGVFVGVFVGVPVGVLVGVPVGVLVGVFVGVFVGVPVGVLVGVFVGVLVGVLVGVFVGVLEGVLVGVLVPTCAAWAPGVARRESASPRPATRSKRAGTTRMTGRAERFTIPPLGCNGLMLLQIWDWITGSIVSCGAGTVQ